MLLSTAIATDDMRIFGSISNTTEGQVFESRQALHDSGIHLPLMAGISGSELEGADSIVLSGGYIDDKDYGDEIIYTGEGGRDESSGKQVSHQQLVGRNKALVLSYENQLPVRVVRGSQHKSSFSPSNGYKYEGLYEVTDYWQDVGQEGYTIWRFNLKKIEVNYFDNDEQLNPTRHQVVFDRILRNQKNVFRLKSIYENRCQVCRFTITTPVGKYSEAAHIHPLGKPHNGVDDISNMICLCPNHHKMLDFHTFSIKDDLNLLGINGSLFVSDKHGLNKACLAYHRKITFGIL